MTPREELEKLIQASITAITKQRIDVYSYAIYFDHESKRRISVCIDTEENSQIAVTKSNEWTKKHFKRLLQEGDADSIVNFSFKSGRNHALGDYKYRNLVEYETREDIEFEASHMLPAIKAVIAHQAEIVNFSQLPEKVLFSCSTDKDEFGVSWFTLD